MPTTSESDYVNAAEEQQSFIGAVQALIGQLETGQTFTQLANELREMNAALLEADAYGYRLTDDESDDARSMLNILETLINAHKERTSARFGLLKGQKEANSATVEETIIERLQEEVHEFSNALTSHNNVRKIQIGTWKINNDATRAESKNIAS